VVPPIVIIPTALAEVQAGNLTPELFDHVPVLAETVHQASCGTWGWTLVDGTYWLLVEFGGYLFRQRYDSQPATNGLRIRLAE
jgi:hypothetical protein